MHDHLAWHAWLVKFQEINISDDDWTVFAVSLHLEVDHQLCVHLCSNCIVDFLNAVPYHVYVETLN